MRQMALVAFLQAQNCTDFAASWRHPAVIQAGSSGRGRRDYASLKAAVAAHGHDPEKFKICPAIGAWRSRLSA